jgi:hypothetical protein
MGNTPCFELTDGCKGSVSLKLPRYFLLPSRKEGSDNVMSKQLS